MQRQCLTLGGSGLASLTMERRLTIIGTWSGLCTVPLSGSSASGSWECEVQLASDPFASGRHARLERGPRGFTLTDIHSRNGTFLDWERVAPVRTQ